MNELISRDPKENPISKRERETEILFSETQFPKERERPPPKKKK
jgi:hypothetical protein